MKSAVLHIALATAGLFGPSQFAIATTCSSQGGQAGQLSCSQGGQFGGSLIDPYAPVSNIPDFSTAPASSDANAAPPSVPSAKITVVSAGLPGSRSSQPAAPAARLTVVKETAAAPKPDDSDLANALDTIGPKGSEVAAETPADKEEIDPALKGLVGTWLAVARHGGGELTTVELQLDDRGWAKLTVPGADGKPSTFERRVKLEDEVLKLSGPEADLILGKLIESNNRQLVLARNDSQVTFVRP